MGLMMMMLPLKALAASMTLNLNGKNIYLPSDQQPYINKDSRTMVSIRGLADAFGYAVTWDDKTSSAKFTYGGTTVIVPSNSNTITVNGKAMGIDTKAENIAGRVYVPIRFISQAMGSNVVFDAATNQVKITATGTYYTVQAGDTMWSIAQKHNVTTTQLKQWNGLSSDIVSVGQKLRVSATGSTGTDTPSSTSVYVVQNGDTLYKIASQFNMTVTDLKTKNQLKSDVLTVGQKLTISGTASSGGSTTTPPPTATKTATVDVSGALNVRSGAGTSYSVVTTVSNGTKVTVLSESNGWSKIQFGSTTGWVSSSYLTTSTSTTTPPPTTTKTATVNVSGSLNVRSGAGTSYSIVTTVSNGTTVTVLSESNGWSKVQFGSTTGWVSSSYLSYGGTTTTPSTGSLRGKVIVLDPGHGGNDAGASGSDGVSYERDLTLLYSQEVKSKLQGMGATVYLTRENSNRCGNVYSAGTTPDLQCRIDVAKNKGADIFVSLHFNSSVSSSATGTETYFNETSNYDGTVNPYPAQSKKLAQAVHRNFQPVLGLTNRGVQNANFYVNRRAKMPSILIEVGFVSSPFDLSRIKNTTIRQNATAGIAKGINEYFTN